MTGKRKLPPSPKKKATSTIKFNKKQKTTKTPAPVWGIFNRISPAIDSTSSAASTSLKTTTKSKNPTHTLPPTNSETTPEEVTVKKYKTINGKQIEIITIDSSPSTSTLPTSESTNHSKSTILPTISNDGDTSLDELVRKAAELRELERLEDLFYWGEEELEDATKGLNSGASSSSSNVAMNLTSNQSIMSMDASSSPLTQYISIENALNKIDKDEDAAEDRLSQSNSNISIDDTEDLEREAALVQAESSISNQLINPERDESFEGPGNTVTESSGSEDEWVEEENDQDTIMEEEEVEEEGEEEEGEGDVGNVGTSIPYKDKGKGKEVVSGSESSSNQKLNLYYNQLLELQSAISEARSRNPDSADLQELVEESEAAVAFAAAYF